ncbi:MAG: hypothetical protein ABH871_06145 [Pseudomonadota bacterium]
MMKLNHSIPRLFATVCLCALIAGFGCKKPSEQVSERKSAEPVASARQTISAPTLAPEALPAEKKPTLEPEGQKEPFMPRGPITLPPSPEQAPKPSAEAAPLPAESETPLATLPGAPETKQPEQEPGEKSPISALPAPELPIETEAKPKEAEPVPYEPRLVVAKTNIDIILDASGSMSAPLGAGTQSKFDVLRQALYDVVYELIQQQTDFPRNIAVRLMGSTQEAATNNCEDTELAIGMGDPNLDAIRTILDKTNAQGQSPIAYTLEKAVDDFPSGGVADRVIVLAADGADSCEGSPCEVASGLAEDIIIHVIAFDVAPEDQEKLSCIAKNADGQFFLARNEGELRSSLDQAINSTMPYNLKLTASAGGAPLPFRIIVYKVGTQEVVRSGESLGTKLLSLTPGTYDILVEYVDSPEKKKPSKILKGVEVLSTTKVEQTINFDLGRVTLTALDNEGKPVPASFKITKDKGAQQVATIEMDAASKTFFLAPGTYDISADLMESQPDSFSVVESGVEIKLDTENDIVFKFQKGSLSLKGLTTQNQAIPFLFQIYKAGTQQLVASGALPSEGGSVMLAPANYDMVVTGEDPTMVASPRTKVDDVAVKAAESTDLTVMFEMGTITLSAVDGKGNQLPAEFVMKDQKSGLEMAKVSSPTGAPIKIDVPPGTYDIYAYSIKSILEPKPSVPVRGITITADKPTEEIIKFVLGTLRLRGRNAKEQAMRTEFTIYQAASDEIIAKAPPSNAWMIFDLAPGVYDALAVDMTVGAETHPMIWIRDIKVEDGKTISHEAIFTAGKLKVIGRGPNNRIIKSSFKVFQYGSDRELINGVSGNDWEIFEIEPGKYYIEASYHDEADHVTLKKWINVDIGENEVVELIIRF